MSFRTDRKKNTSFPRTVRNWNAHPQDIKEAESLAAFQRTAARWTCRRWRNTSSVGEMLDELKWPSFEARRDQSSLFLFHMILCGTVFIEKDKYNMTPAHNVTTTRLSHNYIVLNIADTRHTVMPWRIPFSPELSHIGIVCLLLWPISSTQRS